MPQFASSVRFQAKYGHEDAFLEANKKFEVANYPGCISHQIINGGSGRFQSLAIWENQDALVAARPHLIEFLDTLRPMLAEISPELGVTDPISGPLVE